MARPEVEKWWGSLKKVLQEKGLDVNNPCVLAQIMVNNQLEKPKGPDGKEMSYFEADVDTLIRVKRENDELFSYALMERNEEGKYRQERPADGKTLNWLYEGLKNLDNAPDDMKEYLFRMSREGRLVLRGTAFERMSRNEVYAITTTEDGTAFLTVPVNQVAGPKCTVYKWEEVSPESQHITLEQVDSIIQTMGVDLDMGICCSALNHRALSLPPDRTEERKRIKDALCWDLPEIERQFSVIGSWHPEWVDTPEKRARMAEKISVRFMMTQIMTPEELEIANSFQEWDPSLQKIEKHLKRLTGCPTIREVMESGRVQSSDGMELPRTDTQAFLHEVMANLNSQSAGLLIRNNEGKTRLYTRDSDAGLQISVFTKGTDATAFRTLLEKIKPGILDQSDAAETLRKAIREVERTPYLIDKGYTATSVLEFKRKMERLTDACGDYSAELAKKDLLSPMDEIRMSALSRIREFSEQLYDGELNIMETLSAAHPGCFREPPRFRTEAFREELLRLQKELRRTDSMLSKDSEEYRGLRDELKELLTEKLPEGSTEPLSAVEMEEKLAKTMQFCRTYMEKHRGLTELSDRQEKRLKVMNRLLDLCDQVEKAQTDPREARREKLAGKLLQNIHIHNLAVGKGQPAESRKGRIYAESKAVLLDHDLMKKQAEQILRNPAFREMAKGNEAELDRLLRTAGPELLKHFNTIRENVRDTQAERPVQAEAEQQQGPYIQI